MTLLIVCALAVILNGQEEYVPQVQAAQMNVERSQVYLDGKGYKLDQQQEKIHKQQEKQREEKLKQKQETQKNQKTAPKRIRPGSVKPANPGSGNKKKPDSGKKKRNGHGSLGELGAELQEAFSDDIKEDVEATIIDWMLMQLLLNIVCRREIRSPKLSYIPYEFIRSESCGCGAHNQTAYIRKTYYQQIRFLKNFHERQDQLTEELLNAEGLNDLMSTVEKHSGILGCEQIWLCVNDYYYDNYERKRWDQDSRKYGRQMILAAGEGGGSDSLKGQRFDTKELLPADIMEKNRFLIFYPLYYNTYSIGYLVMNSISTAAKLNLHKSILSFLEIAIENIRKKCLLRELNTTLDQLYVHDSLTGVYNRHAYNRFGKQAFRSFQESKEGSLIVFCDIDGMKEINDGLGHDFGDIAITAAANILKSACGPADFIMRYGGDEFLVIASGRRKTLPEKVESLNKQYNDTSGMPFQLSLSIGSIFVKEQGGLPLDEYVKQADEAMYMAKKSGKHTS